jgi:hypothetical protein
VCDKLVHTWFDTSRSQGKNYKHETETHYFLAFARLSDKLKRNSSVALQFQIQVGDAFNAP